MRLALLSLALTLAACSTSPDTPACIAGSAYDTICSDRAPYAPTPPNGEACTGSAAPAADCALDTDVAGSALVDPVTGSADDWSIWCCP